jgi:serine/threonine-protein kinase
MTPQPLDVLARQAASRVGTTVRSKYHLDRMLGVGGMAAIYAATHRHGHRVAIKILHDRPPTEDDSFLRPSSPTGSAIRV